MNKFGFKRSITLREALIWVVFVGFAAHLTLIIINKSANAFYDSSVQKLTGNKVNILE